MLGLRRLFPRFNFCTWWGEKKLIEQFVNKKTSSDDYKKQLKILDLKSKYSMYILHLLAIPKVIYHFNNQIEENDLQKVTDHIQHKRYQRASQVISSTSSSQKNTQRLTIAEFIVQVLQKCLLNKSLAQKEAIQELINMFTPGVGHPLDVTIFDQDRFVTKQIKEQPSLTYNPNPFLTSILINKIKGIKKLLFSGSFGIGKSTNLTLLSHLYQVTSLNRWLSPPSMTEKLTFKVIYLSLTKDDQPSDTWTKFSSQCKEIRQDQTFQEPVKTWSDFISRVRKLRSLYAYRMIRLYLVVDQINVYFSSVRKMQQVLCEVEIQKKHKQVTQEVKKQFQQALRAYEGTLRQQYLKTNYLTHINVDQEKVPKFTEDETLNHELKCNREDQIKLRQLLKKLVLLNCGIIFNSSSTIEAHLIRFCLSNNYFCFQSHQVLGMQNYAYGLATSTQQGKFLFCYSCWLQIYQYSHQSVRQKIEKDKQYFIKQLQLLQWPAWVRYLLVKDLLKMDNESLTDLFEIYEQQQKQEEHLKSLSAWIANIHQKVLKASYSNVKNRLSAFMKKGKVSQIYYKRQILQKMQQEVQSQYDCYLQEQQQKKSRLLTDLKEEQRGNNKGPKKYQISMQKLKFQAPDFARANSSDLNSEQAWNNYLKREEATWNQCIKVVADFDIFHLGKYTLTIFSDHKTFIQLIKSLNSTKFYVPFDQQPQHCQDIICSLFNRAMTNMLCYPGPQVSMDTSCFNEKLGKFDFQNKHVVRFGLILRTSLKKAYQNPEQSVVGIAVDNNNLKTKLLVSDMKRFGFDALVVKFHRETNLFELFPIAWGISWSLSRDKCITDLKARVKGWEIRSWWNKSAGQLKKVLAQMTGCSNLVKANICLLIVCPESSYNYQRQLLNEDPISSRPSAHPNMIFQAHVGNAASIEVKGVRYSYLKQVIQRLIYNIKRIECFRTEDIARNRQYQADEKWNESRD